MTKRNKSINISLDMAKCQEIREIITTHINADFDALASMIAAKKLYEDAEMVFPGSQERGLRNFFLNSTSYIFNFKKLREINLQKIRRLILVDTRQRSRIGAFQKILDNPDLEIHIYDHHPSSEDDIEGQIQIIKEVGANTTLMCELLKERRIDITPEEATLLYLGIHEDTGSFTFPSTKIEDHMAAAWLISKGADHNIISTMLTPELTTEQIWLLNDLSKSAKIINVNGVEVVISKIRSDEYIPDFAIIVHRLMELENINALFALAQMEDKVLMIARSRIEDVNVGEIALRFGGGGHPQAASATIKGKTLIQVEKELMECLRQYISPQRYAKDMMTSPVIHISPDKTLNEAATLMTRYNINVLLVMNGDERLLGYITRQIVEKGVYLGIGEHKVKDYMNIEFHTVSPHTPLKKIQELIVQNRLRILPVLEGQKVVGVITRTDLLNILTGGSSVPESLYEKRAGNITLKRKNVINLLRENLPSHILELLKDLGQMGDDLGYKVYLVGGMVRDLFLRYKNLDIDIVIEGDGIRFSKEFSKRHRVKIKIHDKFATSVIIFPDGFKIDVATARIEYYESPGALPVIESSSLKMDLYRRDFTINTLAVRLNREHFGELVDYFGGLKDIKDRVIRVLHNLSFIEDPTRMLRAVRFEQKFGFKIGRLTLSLIKNFSKIPYAHELPGYRIFQELKMILMEDDPIGAIRRMLELGILNLIMPTVERQKDMLKLLEKIKGTISWYDLLFLDEELKRWKVYIYGLIGYMDRKHIEEFINRMRLSGKEAESLIRFRSEEGKLFKEILRLKRGKDMYGILKLLEQYEPEFLLYLMAKADLKEIKQSISSYFTKLKDVKIHITGKDLMEMGFSPGPIFRDILESVREAHLNFGVHTKEQEIRYIKERYGNLLKKGGEI